MTIDIEQMQELYPGITGTWEEGLIGDAFVQPFYISVSENQYPELRVSAAPLLPEIVEETDSKIREATGPTESIVIMANTIAASIKAWSFSKGQPTAQLIRRMRPAQLNKLYRILSNKIPADVDPKLIQKSKPAEVEPLAPMGK